MHKFTNPMRGADAEPRCAVQFGLRTLLLVSGCVACAAAATVNASPLWWLVSIFALSLLGVLSTRAYLGTSRPACLVMAAIAGIGAVHTIGAKYPWTGSWMVGLAWHEATAGNGWFAMYGPSALGIFYALCWAAFAIVSGGAVWLICALRQAIRSKGANRGKRAEQPNNAHEQANDSKLP